MFPSQNPGARDIAIFVLSTAAAAGVTAWVTYYVTTKLQERDRQERKQERRELYEALIAPPMPAASTEQGAYYGFRGLGRP